MDASKQYISDIHRAYDTYADMLFRICFSMLVSKEDAEDAVQEIFIKYMRKEQHFKDGEHEKAWMIRVAMNQCHDMQKHKKLHDHAALEDIGETAVYDSYQKNEVFESVLRLPERYKEVFLLVYFEGFSIKEAAHILRLGESSVKMRIHRGKELLKTILKKEEIL